MIGARAASRCAEPFEDVAEQRARGAGARLAADLFVIEAGEHRDAARLLAGERGCATPHGHEVVEPAGRDELAVDAEHATEA